MSRVPLSELIFKGTNPVKTASGQSVYVYARGTETKATLYTSETGETTVTQPLTTNSSGLPVSGGAQVWVAPGSYTLKIGSSSAPWEASSTKKEVEEKTLLLGAPIGASTFVGQANGSPTTLETGQVLSLTGHPALAIRSETLTFPSTPTEAETGYAIAAMGASVRHVGGTFTLTEGDGTGSGGGICLATWDTLLGPSGAFNSTCHLFISPEEWQLGIWVAGEFKFITPTVFFDVPLQSGVALRADCHINATLGTISLRLPDGSKPPPFYDRRIRELPACEYANWECKVTSSAGSLGAFSEIYAATKGSLPMPNRAPQAPMDVMLAGSPQKGKGESIQRPPSASCPGSTFYDTTLSKLLASNGEYWFEVATGNRVGNLLDTNAATLTHKSSPFNGTWKSGAKCTVEFTKKEAPPGRRSAVELVATEAGELLAFSPVVVTVAPGEKLAAMFRRFKTGEAAAAARKFKAKITFQKAGSVTALVVTSTAVESSKTGWTSSTVATGTAPAETIQAVIYIIVESAVIGEKFYANEFCMVKGETTEFLEP